MCPLPIRTHPKSQASLRRAIFGELLIAQIHSHASPAQAFRDGDDRSTPDEWIQYETAKWTAGEDAGLHELFRHRREVRARVRLCVHRPDGATISTNAFHVGRLASSFTPS